MSTLQQDVSWAPSARAQEIPRQGLMRNPAYWDRKHPQFPTYRRAGESPRASKHLIKRAFQILYPGDAKYDATGRMIDSPPLAPHIVAKQVDAVNFEMESLDARAAGRREDSGRPPAGALKDNMVHVESHTRDGGKTEVSDYWRNLPSSALGAREPASGHGDDADKGDPETQNDPGQDTLPGQPGEDDLAEAKGAPKDAFVVTKKDLDAIVKEWPGQWHYPENEKEENRHQCTALVKAAIPEIGRTPTWREGEKIIGPGNPPLTPGTAIATFDKNGKYTNTSGESHAGIFLEYGTHNGKDGMWIMDQHQGQEAKKTFLAFNDPGSRRTYQAERYSVIRRKP